MVTYIKNIIALIIIISISSCSIKKSVTDEEIQIVNKEISFGLDMGMLIESYTKFYAKSPTSANDLIIYIEGMDKDSQLVYLRQHKYLKKNREKLVFTTDTENIDSEILNTISIYYKEAIPCKGLFKAFVYLPVQTIEQETP